MKRKRVNPERTGRDNPAWSADTFKRARSASEVLPLHFSGPTAERMLRPRGRPKSASVRVAISLRLPPETLAQWKATGPGWQTRMAERLKRVG